MDGTTPETQTENDFPQMAHKAQNVIEAISLIMAEVGSVEKRGENKFHGYYFATASDLLHKLQPLMARHGLVVFQHQKSLDMIDDGKAMAIQYEFTLAHASGDIWKEKPVHTGVATSKNSKGGFDDKAANKCHTAARKYFLLALFQVPTGDYEDADSDEGGNAQQNGKAQQSKPANTKANTAAGNGQAKAQQSKPDPKTNGNTKATGRPADGSLYLVNPSSGEFETFTRMSDFLTRLENRLQQSDDPLAWLDQNKGTFEKVSAKLEGSEAGQEHIGRINDLVSQIKAALKAPVNTPDYSQA